MPDRPLRVTLVSLEPWDGVWRRNVNTCHVWAEDAPMVQALESGTYAFEVPVFLRARLAQLGIDPAAGGAA